jgi:hypothetical protein
VGSGLLLKKIVPAFPWGTLKKGSKIVDVGGGIGSSTLVLAKTFRELNFVVQDTPGAIKDGRDVSKRHIGYTILLMYLRHSIGITNFPLP